MIKLRIGVHLPWTRNTCETRKWHTMAIVVEPMERPICTYVVMMSCLGVPVHSVAWMITHGHAIATKREAIMKKFGVWLPMPRSTTEEATYMHRYLSSVPKWPKWWCYFCQAIACHRMLCGNYAQCMHNICMPICATGFLHWWKFSQRHTMASSDAKFAKVRIDCT